MEPIKIELNLERLRPINHCLSSLTYEPTNERMANVNRSILDQLGKKLMKKQIDVYPSQKTFKFKMTYYEADALERFIRDTSPDIAGLEEMHHHSMRMVADEINQKLA
tara:strand:- start:12 stop:335 length:324 start_codon:yes stop_codon:yes gene_type:complete